MQEHYDANNEHQPTEEELEQEAQEHYERLGPSYFFSTNKQHIIIIHNITRLRLAYPLRYRGYRIEYQ